jgi:hypothetical protein
VARNLSAATVHRETRQIKLGDVDQVQATIRFGGGDLDIQALNVETLDPKPQDGDDTLLLQGRFVYNIDSLEPVIDYDVQDEQAKLQIRHKGTDAIRLDRLTTELRNEWELELCDNVPMSLDLDVGAASGRFELGGLRIQRLDLTTGAADLWIGFDKPNPEPLEAMRVFSGAAKLELIGLGNANLDELTFDGGLGTYTFDLSGNWKRSAKIYIQAGASQVRLRVPRDVGVHVCPGDLRRAHYGGLDREGDCYVNSLYDQSSITLDISLDLGLGELDIKQVN